jgi:hypothetical protein
MQAHVEVTLRQVFAEVIDSRGRIAPLRRGLTTVCVDAGTVRDGYGDVALSLLKYGAPVPGPSESSLRARPDHQVELVGVAAAPGPCGSP